MGRRRSSALHPSFPLAVLWVLLLLPGDPCDCLEGLPHPGAPRVARSPPGSGEDTPLSDPGVRGDEAVLLSDQDKRAAFNSWAGKRDLDDKRAAFNSWAGKRDSEEKRAAFNSWAGKRDFDKRPAFSSWAGKRDFDEKRAAFNSWAGKRDDEPEPPVFPSWSDGTELEDKRAAFNSWAGKRDSEEKRAAFNSWAGKRDSEEKRAAFNSWAGKRDLEDKRAAFNSWAGKRDSEEKRAAFNSWAGKRDLEDKRAAFNSWAGKRAAFNSWAGKRAAFNSWAGKRAAFNSWAGKRDLEDKRAAFNSWAGKRAAFNSWAGKRAAFNSWAGKRAAFNSWAGKRDSDDKRAAFYPWAGKRAAFNSWAGKRDEESLPDDLTITNFSGELTKKAAFNEDPVSDAQLKRAPFHSWAGKRMYDPSEESLDDNKRAAFNSWAGKRFDGDLDLEDKRAAFNSWAGKRLSHMRKRATDLMAPGAKKVLSPRVGKGDEAGHTPSESSSGDAQDKRAFNAWAGKRSHANGDSGTNTRSKNSKSKTSPEKPGEQNPSEQTSVRGQTSESQKQGPGESLPPLFEANGRLALEPHTAASATQGDVNGGEHPHTIRKRAAFSAWAGKRFAVDDEDEKRAFSPWSGKRLHLPSLSGSPFQHGKNLGAAEEREEPEDAYLGLADVTLEKRGGYKSTEDYMEALKLLSSTLEDFLRKELHWRPRYRRRDGAVRYFTPWAGK